MNDAPALAFDVNETLLDLAALDPVFAELFGHAGARREWFGQVLQSALTCAATGTYVDFSLIGRGALDMLATRHGTVLADADRAAVAETMRTLPPHPEVADALDRLAAAGRRQVALTNSPPQVAEAQLTHAGLRDHFEAVLTVEGAQALKPAPEVYQHAASELGVAIQSLRLVAAHTWDVTGAIRAGARAAFVARPGMVLDPSGETPDVVGRDLAEVAERILAVDA